MSDAVVEKIYDTGLIASMTREELKKRFPDHKFSVTIKRFSGGSELNLALMTSPVSPYTDGKGPAYEQMNDRYLDDYLKLPRPDYPSQMCREWTLTPEACSLLKEVCEIANRHNWDNSDIQSDYFDVNYYFHLAIGRWNNPFKVVAK